MKSKWILLVWTCFILILVISCVKKDDFPVLKGPYLGQRPPGMTPEIFAPGIISTGYADICISFTPDAKEVYYTVGGLPHSVILLMKEVDGKWTQPQVAPFSGRYSSECQLSPDGNRMYFCAGVPLSGSGDPKGNWDIWMVERTSNGWGEAERLDPPFSSDEYSTDYPSVSANGNLYFYSSGLEGGKGGGDIWISKFTNGKYDEPQNLGSTINTEYYDMDPFIAPDESYLIFSSAKPGGFGANDLYVSFQNEDGTWSEVINLGESINSYAHEIHPFVSRDGKYLFFCSKRRMTYQRYSEPTLTYEQKIDWLKKPGNELEDIYWVDAKIIEELKPDKFK